MPSAETMLRQTQAIVRQAVGADDAQTIRAAVAAGACSRESEANGSTLLHFSAILGCPEAAEALIEAGAEVDATHAGGRTPLWEAAVWGWDEVAALLLQHGADPLVRDTDGFPLMAAARGSGNRKMVAMLAAAGAAERVLQSVGSLTQQML